MQRAATASLYEHDFALWVAEQVKLLHAAAFEGRLLDVDVENVIEELEGLARRDRSKLLSHITVVALHVFKLQIQPATATRSRLVFKNNSATKVRKLLAQSPSMANLVSSYISEAYVDARRQASVETGLPITDVPPQMSADFARALEPRLHLRIMAARSRSRRTKQREMRSTPAVDVKRRGFANYGR